MASPVLARILLFFALVTCSTSFLSAPLRQRTITTNPLFFHGSSRAQSVSPFHQSPSMILLAKKKKKSAPKGQGFGKVDIDNDDDAEDADDAATTGTTTATATSEGSPFALESLVSTSQQSESSSRNAVVDTTPVDVRTQRILREKYGLKPISEQQADLMPDKSVDPRNPATPEDEFDIMTKLPEPVLLAIDRFLKLGLTVSAVLFIAAGLGVTWEAWSVTSNTPIPEDIDRFITDVVEPNFTTGLFVLLGFSISLGLFASAQLGSQSSQYRED